MVNVPPTVNVRVEFSNVQDGEHDEVKLLIAREFVPFSMEAEAGKFTEKDWPVFPVAVNESACVVVSGQTALVAVAVPSGRTVIVCCVVVERQIFPKSKTAP